MFSNCRVRRSQLIFPIILCVFFISVFPQSKADKIDQLLNKYLEYKAFNGVALVAENGDVIFKKGYGYANFEWEIQNTPDTKFRLGSITKQFTSMLIMQLVQRGKIRLEEKVSEILPNYPKEQGTKITIHNLLTHTSGIPNYTDLSGFEKEVERNPYTPKQLVNLFKDLPLEFDPGTKFSYSNSGYILLGYIIEKITGKSYEDVLKENILDPLGMSNTGYDHNSEILPKRAYGYDRLVNTLKNTSYIDMSVPYSAGALYSTVEDLYKWDQSLYTDKLLSQENIKKLFGKYIPALGANYGYGWLVIKASSGKGDSVNIVTHGGAVNGFNSLIVRYLDDKNLIVLFNNTGGTDLQAIAGNIKKILYNEKYELPMEPEIIKFTEIISKYGVDEGLKYFHSLKEDEKKNLSENDLNNLGYSLLGSNKVEEAIKIFKLNIELYPGSFNTYDSYGEALLKDGQKQEAIINYKKSLELNPGNENAVQILKNLGVELKSEEKAKQIEPAVFEQYVGEYQLAPGFTITISTENNKFYEQATGQQKFEIFPSSDTEYYLKVVNAQITFEKDGSGKVVRIILHQNGKNVPGEKIK